MPYLEQMMDMNNEDGLRLSFFIADVDDLFSKVLEARWLLFDESLRGPLEDACFAMRERVLRIRDAEDVDRMEAELVQMIGFGRDFERALEGEGLAGPELHAKLRGYVNARQVLNRNGGVKNWKRTWRWMKAILQSLGTAFPPAGAILELADLIENGAKDIEDLA